jgi:hypothetical protein
MLPVGNPISRMKDKTDVLQGTLALMVLKTLDVLGHRKSRHAISQAGAGGFYRLRMGRLRE